MSAITYDCPNGHPSTDPEYCSECGKKLSATSVSAPAGATPNSTAPSTSGGGEACPDCGTPRASPTAVFCEVCRYNFVSKQSWTPNAPMTAPAVPATPTAAPPLPTTAPPPLPTGTTPDLPRRWEAVAVVDPALYVDPDPANPLPVGAPERVFPLDFPENLIGRRSERRAIYPEIDLSGDSGVSSRHAIVYREADGSLSLLDVGSTNGSQVNGSEVAPGVRVPLADGDQITVGCWTRITLRAAGGKP
ncbi:MAG: FHA domain-containing protein [Fibrella sp.]|nr:FHA domain-containing protein [Armatimonadota bacterium]